jgi:hypothetical protein
MANENLILEWNDKVAKALVGKKIINASYMTNEEMNILGWSKRALIIQFDDGTYMYASADDEGNNAGALYTDIKGLPIIPTI